jgi:hypothetical protein
MIKIKKIMAFNIEKKKNSYIEKVSIHFIIKFLN